MYGVFKVGKVYHQCCISLLKPKIRRFVVVVA